MCKDVHTSETMEEVCSDTVATATFVPDVCFLSVPYRQNQYYYYVSHMLPLN
jgi:hypothetical protein